MSTLADLLVLLASVFLYGMKGIIGRWLVTITFRILKRFYIDTEHELEIFIKAFRKEYHR